VSTASAALLLVEALRLDHDPLDLIRRRAFDALELGVGGFLLFGGDAAAASDLLMEVREAAGRPLWLAADLERGAGQQFAGCTSLPPPAALARHPEAEVAVRQAARITGHEARSLGLNWVLAPVLDLDLQGANPIVGTRSFGDDPVGVGRLGRLWVEACQSAGPAACAKHFPGHGRTLADSHLELPVVSASAAQLELDIAPFAESATVVDTIMAAHVAYPALSGGVDGNETDRQRPATRDAALLQDLLRRRLGFAGLVVSDALTMRGFSVPEDEGPAAVEALRAGCDLLLYPADIGRTAGALERAAEADSEIADRMEEARARSAAVLLQREAVLAGSGNGGASRAVREVQSLADGSILEWPQPAGAPAGSDGSACAGLNRDRTLLVHVFSDDVERPAVGEPGRAFTETLRELGWDARLASEAEVDASAEPDKPPAGGHKVVLVISSPHSFNGHASLSPDVSASVGREMASGGCLVVLGHPRLLESIGRSGVCAWSAEPLMERAAARWLAREASRPGVAGELPPNQAERE
jgi:beta-glucosidase